MVKLFELEKKMEFFFTVLDGKNAQWKQKNCTTYVCRQCGKNVEFAKI